MKKKAYEKPTMEVVELPQQTRLLAGSVTSAGMDVTLEEEDWPIPGASGMPGFFPLP